MSRWPAAVLALALGACHGDAAPDRPTAAVVVVATLPGATAAEVEAQLLTPLERAVAGVGTIRQLDGTATADVATVAAQLAPGADPDEAAARIRDAVAAAAPTLPPAAGTPTIQRVDPQTLTVLATLPIDERTSPLDAGLRARELRARVERLAGVGGVTLCGEAEPAVRVEVDPARLAAAGITIHDVAAAIRAADVAVPGGALTTGGIATTVRVTGAGSLDELRALRVSPQVRIDDVAAVIDQPRLPCRGITAAGPVVAIAVDVRDRRAARAVVDALRAAGATPLAPAVAIGELDGADDATLARLADRLVDAGPLLARVHARPPRLELVVELARGDDGAARLDAIDAAVAREAAGALRWRGVPGLEAVVAADDLDAAVTAAERAAGQLATDRQAPVLATRRVPTLAITIDRQRAADLGVPVATIADTVAAARGGLRAGSLGRAGGDADVEVVVAGPAAAADLPSLTVATAAGAVPLGAVTTIEQRSELAPIVHRDRRRVVTLWVRAPAARRDALRRALAAALPGATIHAVR